MTKNLKRFLLAESVHVWLWIAVAALLLGGFIILTSEVQEAAAGRQELIGTIDRLPNQFLQRVRNPKLNEAAVDLSALGSATTVSTFVVLISALLVVKKRYADTAHLILAAVGSGLLTSLMKSYFERSRPDILAHLVNVQGYSYPSGHSLTSAAVYFTFAVLLCEWFPKRRQRALIIGFTLLFILVIALSRVYLGVHYVSDVLAGMLVGIGWASLLGVARSYFKLRSRPLYGNVD